jgi:hypothetical protein
MTTAAVVVRLIGDLLELSPGKATIIGREKA